MLFISLYARNPGFAQELSVDFKEQLVIGGQEDAPKEYLFGGPEFIETDSEYRIYVATSNNTIRVFSPEGKHLKTLGGRGRGPGEFLYLSAMAIGADDELIVYDSRSRRLTTFYNLGDSVTTNSFNNPHWLENNIVPLNDGTYAATSSLVSPSARRILSEHVPGYEPIHSGNNILYILNQDFSERTHSFFDPYRYMFDREHPLEIKFARSPDFILASLNDSTLALTHNISNGNIYLINRNNGDIREIEGRFTDRESYEQLSYENRRDYIETHFGLVTGGGVAYQKKLESRALLSNDKWVLNFVKTAEKNDYTYGIEFLDKKGNYLGYTSIVDDFTIVQEGYSDFIGAELMQFKFYPKHLDNRDQLYYVDHSSGVPVIRVTKIILEE